MAEKDLPKAVYAAAQALTDAIGAAETAGYIVGPRTVQNALKIITVSGESAQETADRIATEAKAAAPAPAKPADAPAKS